MGDIVGFVQAGDIVVPVTATQGGTVRGVPVADGDLVGYGEVLAWLD